MFRHRVAILLFALALPAQAATLFVSPEGNGLTGLTWESAFPTIAEAITASSTGDEIWIRSATYVENLTIEESLSLIGGFAGTETLDQRSLADPKANPTVIDGDFKDAVITINSNCNIENCSFIRGGRFLRSGGGLKVIDANVSLKNIACLLNGEGPDGLLNYGGGMYLDSATCKIEDSTISGNTVSTLGGGIFARGSNVEISGCVFKGNTANLGGGIVFADGTGKSLRITSSVFDGNEHTDSVINPGQGDGSVMIVSGTTTVSVENCLFTGNHDTVNYFQMEGGPSPQFINCTFDVPEESWAFAQKPRDGKVPPILVNCIVRGHSEALYRVDRTDPEVAPIVSFSNIEGGYPGEGNIDSDPRFVDPEGGDYHLKRGSPCIDSGTDTGLATDFDGKPRPTGLYDMGAFEFPYLRSDINRDGVVDMTDLFIFQGDWKRTSEPQ